MPFRRSRLARLAWLLPTFVIVTMLSCLLWGYLAFDLYGGVTRTPAGARIGVFAFIGGVLFDVIGVVVTVALVQAAIEELRLALVAAHIPPPPQEKENE